MTIAETLSRAMRGTQSPKPADETPVPVEPTKTTAARSAERLSADLKTNQDTVAALEAEVSDHLLAEVPDYDRLAECNAQIDRLVRAGRGIQAALAKATAIVEQEAALERKRAQKAESDRVFALTRKSVDASHTFVQRFGQAVDAFKDLIEARAAIPAAWPAWAGGKPPEGLFTTAHEVLKAVELEMARQGATVHRLGGAPAPEIPSMPGCRAPVMQAQNPSGLPSLNTVLTSANIEIVRLLT